MPEPLTAGLPPNMGLWAGCVIRVIALDPTTGNVVTGVNVSDFSITVENLAGGDLAAGQFEYVPGPGS